MTRQHLHKTILANIKKGSCFTQMVILLLLSSCASQITEKTAIPHSQEVLVHKAFKEFGVEETNNDFIVSQDPDNSNETIIVIPEMVNKEDDSYELNTHIAIANNTTGKITHRYFESSKTNGWVSNAIFIDAITIDTLNYKLAKSKNAFGILVNFRSMSQPNPYHQKSISLFVKEKDGLKKVLDMYSVYESYGEVNVNACYAKFDRTNSKLSMDMLKTNGYYDILVKNTITQINYQEDKNGECNPVEKIITIDDEVLRFNGTSYQKTSFSN